MNNSVINFICNLLSKCFGLTVYRYVVTYSDKNGNKYELFFEKWNEADECAMKAFNSGKQEVSLKIK